MIIQGRHNEYKVHWRTFAGTDSIPVIYIVNKITRKNIITRFLFGEIKTVIEKSNWENLHFLIATTTAERLTEENRLRWYKSCIENYEAYLDDEKEKEDNWEKIVKEQEYRDLRKDFFR